MNIRQKIMGHLLIFGLTSLFFSNVFAHGEDKLGPNGGYIRMPGAFHTEVVPVGRNQLKLYLLDINWKNPSLTNSKAIVKIEKNKNTAKCIPQNNQYFLCTFPKKIDFSHKNTLWIEATRENQKGMKVKYELPLRLEGSEHDSHSK